MKLIEKFTAAAMGATLVFSSTAALAESAPLARSIASSSEVVTAEKNDRNNRRGNRDGHSVRRGDRGQKHVTPRRSHRRDDRRDYRNHRDNDRSRDYRRHDNRRDHDRNRHRDQRIIIPIPIPFPVPHQSPYRGYNLSRQFQQCVNYTSGSAASNRAAHRIVNRYPHIAPYAHAQWRVFEHQVAQGICREELNMQRRAINAGPFSIVVPPYLLRR